VGVIISLVVLGSIASVAVPIFFVVSQVSEEARSISYTTKPTQDASATHQEAASLPCEDAAQRYRSCLVDDDGHSDDEARAVVDPLRMAAQTALAAGDAADEETACATQFEEPIERCEGRGGLLGRLRSRSSGNDDATDDDDRPSLISRLRGESDEPEPPVDMSRFQPLGGCECRAGRNGPRVELNLAVRGSKTVLGDPAYEYNEYTVTDWVLSRDEETWQLPATMQTAPPEALPGWRSTIGFACHEDTVIVASVRRVSAWALGDRKLLWTTELDEPFGDDFGLGRRGSYQLNCRSLTVRKDLVEIPLDRRRQLRLALSDGKRR
jgi:hypothetical protein